MRNFRPVSITDDPPPLSDEWVGLVMETPEQLASRVSLEAERVFDDFDYFSFVGLEIDGCRLGPRPLSWSAADHPRLHTQPQQDQQVDAKPPNQDWRNEDDQHDDNRRDV